MPMHYCDCAGTISCFTQSQQTWRPNLQHSRRCTQDDTSTQQYMPNWNCQCRHSAAESSRLARCDASSPTSSMQGPDYNSTAIQSLCHHWIKNHLWHKMILLCATCTAFLMINNMSFMAQMMQIIMLTKPAVRQIQHLSFNLNALLTRAYGRQTLLE